MAVLLMLTFVAGGTDVTTFLYIGGAFVSNQTGTVLLLAMDAGGSDVVDAGSALASIGGFLIGATISGRLLPRLGPEQRWPPRATAGLLLETAVLAVCVAITWLLDPSDAVVVGLLGLAMGHQVALASRMAMPYITAGYVTGSMTKAAMASPAGDRSQRTWWHVATPVAAIAVGAVVTGAIAAQSVPAAVAVLAIIVLAAALMVHRADKREIERRLA